MIDDQYLVVKEFGLFSTVFRRVDGQEIIVPNSLLSNTKLVHNMRRSTSMYVVSDLPTVIYETHHRQVGEYDYHDILQYLFGDRRAAQTACTGLCHREWSRMVRLWC